MYQRQTAPGTKRYIGHLALDTERYIGQVALFPTGMLILVCHPQLWGGVHASGVVSEGVHEDEKTLEDFGDVLPWLRRI